MQDQNTEGVLSKEKAEVEKGRKKKGENKSEWENNAEIQKDGKMEENQGVTGDEC